MLKATTNSLEFLLMSVASLVVLVWLYLSLNAKERREVKAFVDDLDAVHRGDYDYPKRTAEESLPESRR